MALFHCFCRQKKKSKAKSFATLNSKYLKSNASLSIKSISRIEQLLHHIIIIRKSILSFRTTFLIEHFSLWALTQMHTAIAVIAFCTQEIWHQTFTRNNFQKNWIDSWIVMMALFSARALHFVSSFFHFSVALSAFYCVCIWNTFGSVEWTVSAHWEKNGSNFNQSLRWLLFISWNALYNFAVRPFWKLRLWWRRKKDKNRTNDCFQYFKLRQTRQQAMKKTGWNWTINNNKRIHINVHAYIGLKWQITDQRWTLYGNQWSFNE